MDGFPTTADTIRQATTQTVPRLLFAYFLVIGNCFKNSHHPSYK
jgi:hypothetical protein